jgi:hypothetical protein
MNWGTLRVIALTLWHFILNRELSQWTDALAHHVPTSWCLQAGQSRQVLSQTPILVTAMIPWLSLDAAQHWTLQPSFTGDTTKIRPRTGLVPLACVGHSETAADSTFLDAETSVDRARHPTS